MIIMQEIIPMGIIHSLEKQQTWTEHQLCFVVPFWEGATSVTPVLCLHTKPSLKSFLTFSPRNLFPSLYSEIELSPLRRSFCFLFSFCTKKLFKVALSEEENGAKDGDWLAIGTR